MKKIRTYLPFTFNTFQMILSYKANVIIFMMGEWFMLMVTFFLWKAIFASSPDRILNGFSLEEMYAYIMFSFLTGLMTNVDITFDITREVKDGTIAINLIRPISYEMRMLFQALGGVLYNFVIIFIGAFLVVNVLLFNSNGTVYLQNLPLYLISMGLGLMINFYFSYTFGLLSFKLTNMWGVSQIMGALAQLLSGALIPLVFFPEAVQKVIQFLPFSSIIYTPVMIYLGKISGAEALAFIALQLLWLIMMILLSRAVWKAVVKSITILGG